MGVTSPRGTALEFPSRGSRRPLCRYLNRIRPIVHGARVLAFDCRCRPRYHHPSTSGGPGPGPCPGPCQMPKEATSPPCKTMRSSAQEDDLRPQTDVAAAAAAHQVRVRAGTGIGTGACEAASCRTAEAKQVGGRRAPVPLPRPPHAQRLACLHASSMASESRVRGPMPAP